jgi:hypothetical protein
MPAGFTLLRAELVGGGVQAEKVRSAVLALSILLAAFPAAVEAVIHIFPEPVLSAVAAADIFCTITHYGSILIQIHLRVQK